MANEWKMVPVEPTAEMEDVGCQAYLDAEGMIGIMHKSSMGHAFQAMLAAAPVPPAGDVEVLALSYSDGNPVRLTDLGRIQAAKGGVTELVDRAHVTRLTAERDGLKERVSKLDKRVREEQAYVSELAAEHTALQSELAKVLEDLRLEKVAGAAIRQQAEDFKALSWERGQELTKARELLRVSNPGEGQDCKAWWNKRVEVLQGQSAPAAKGVSDE